MEKPMEQLRQFFELAAKRRLCGNDQLMYLQLWNAFNRARYPETLELTDAELLRRMNQYDANGAPLRTLKVIKARLKQKGFIDFKAGSGEKPTAYRLIELVEAAPEVNEPPVKAAPAKGIAVPKKVEATREIVPAKKVEPTRNVSDVLAIWAECGGVTPNSYIAQVLTKQAETYGVEFMAAAIQDAQKANIYPRMNYLYFEKFLERRLSRKGGWQDGGTGRSTEQYADLLDTEVPDEYAVW